MMQPFNDATRQMIAARCAAFARLEGEPEEGLKRAAVAIVLVEADVGPDETALLLTQRASGLRAHSSQWALPGGRCDAGETAIAGALREPLLRLCARYLVGERAPSGRALDPVAHFHLSNGARVERLNWLADVSVKGLQQSAGIMVNYLYRLGEIEANHEAYRGEGRVAASSALRNLARGG